MLGVEVIAHYYKTHLDTKNHKAPTIGQEQSNEVACNISYVPLCLLLKLILPHSNLYSMQEGHSKLVILKTV